MKKFHDTHVHFDLNSMMDKNLKYVEKNEIYSIVMTTIPSQFNKLKKYNNYNHIRIALGFHPELIYEYKNNIPFMWELINEAKYIGEVGLDYTTKDLENKKCQKEFMINLISRLSESKQSKILSIHSRKAESDMLSIIPKNRNFKIILHWYSGPLYLIDKFNEKDVYFSFNHKQLATKKGVEILKRIPLKKILLESDYPFTTINNSEYSLDSLVLTVKYIGEILKIKNAKELCSQNFNDLIIETFSKV